MQHVIRTLLNLLADKLLRKMAMPGQGAQGQVYLPLLLLIIGLIGLLIFLVPAVIILCLGESWILATILFLLSPIGGSMIIGYINCRISYDEDSFDARNFFGIRRHYTYYDITGIRENAHECFIYMGKHRIMVDEYSIGGQEFLIHIKKKYSALHRGRMIPRISPKFDLFNGHVSDAGGILFGFILTTILLIGFNAFLIHHTYAPSTTENTIKHTVCFDAHSLSKDEIELFSTDGQCYAIRFIDEQFDPTPILSVCDGETAVTVYCVELDPDDKEPYYSLKAIVLDGVHLLTFEETGKFHSQEYFPLVLIFCSLFLLWCLYMAAFIIVARNPKKFSKRTVRFFAKNINIQY